jgi:hypothetical protein
MRKGPCWCLGRTNSLVGHRNAVGRRLGSPARTTTCINRVRADHRIDPPHGNTGEAWVSHSTSGLAQSLSRDDRHESRSGPRSTSISLCPGIEMWVDMSHRPRAFPAALTVGTRVDARPQFGEMAAASPPRNMIEEVAYIRGGRGLELPAGQDTLRARPRAIRSSRSVAAAC